MSNILILEDDPIRHQAFRNKLSCQGNNLTIVTTAAECIKSLKNDNFDVVCLDHDLGGKQFEQSGPGTGYEVAVWLSKNHDFSGAVIIHSFNPVGAELMYRVLKDRGILVVKCPGLWNLK